MKFGMSLQVNERRTTLCHMTIQAQGHETLKARNSYISSVDLLDPPFEKGTDK